MTERAWENPANNVRLVSRALGASIFEVTSQLRVRRPEPKPRKAPAPVAAPAPVVAKVERPERRECYACARYVSFQSDDMKGNCLLHRRFVRGDEVCNEFAADVTRFEK